MPGPRESAQALYDAEIAPTVEITKAMLAGKHPAIQGAILAELFSIFVAGHRPDIREEIIDQHLRCTREMVALIDKEEPRPWAKN